MEKPWQLSTPSSFLNVVSQIMVILFCKGIGWVGGVGG